MNQKCVVKCDISNDNIINIEILSSAFSIREITTRSSIGMYRGALQMISRPGLSYQDWGIEIFWQPSSDDIGRQPYCFSAIDSEGFVSFSLLPFIYYKIINY